MSTPDRAQELQDCRLCGWRCGVNRVEGETGVCGLGLPRVASTTLHPAPPASFTVFMAGCNFCCLFCQNWTISTYPATGHCAPRRMEPSRLATKAVEKLESAAAKRMRADRIFFSGGSPGPSFPYIEETVAQARRQKPGLKVNYDANGFLAPPVFERMLEMTTSVTFDIRAVDDDVHREMTGAPVGPVLRNARTVARHPGKLWEFRVLVVPGFNVDEIPRISGFIADLDPSLPVCFLAFRPNFWLEELRGATRREMEQAVQTARSCGLKNVSWSGRPGLAGQSPGDIIPDSLQLPCPRRPRRCGACPDLSECPVRRHTPRRHQ